MYTYIENSYTSSIHVTHPPRDHQCLWWWYIRMSRQISVAAHSINNKNTYVHAHKSIFTTFYTLAGWAVEDSGMWLHFVE